MASREGDTALWLHNKLGSTDDFWSGRSICSQLTRDKLQNIQGCFQTLQPHVKVKLMLSFLHLSRRNVEEWRVDLEEILDLASNDSDQWVTTVADILRPYPSSGNLNLDIDDSNPTFTQILVDLKKLVKKSSDAGMLPLECLYLSTKALNSLAGQQPAPVKHFALKRKPKSAALRAELLQKSAEAAQHMKKGTTSNSLPIKVRSFAKKMDDTTPMKGIPSRTPGFRSPSATSRLPGGIANMPYPSRTPTRLQKEGRIKLLDIADQPAVGKEAKRRKRQQELEAQEQQKREKEAAASTPDYAAGLLQPATPRPGPQTTSGSTPAATYVPNSSNRLPTLTGGSATLPTSSISAATQQARDNLQQQLQQQLGGSQIKSQPTGQPNQPVTNGQQQQPQKKGLSLTREQMLEAQEMFRNSNKVTRPEKALILGFMAGSRENPCPQQGNIVNIRLSETTENVDQGGTIKQMYVDTFFVMDYGTGEWKRVRKYRDYTLE